jgi:hypothetical protein
MIRYRKNRSTAFFGVSQLVSGADFPMKKNLEIPEQDYSGEIADRPKQAVEDIVLQGRSN